MKGMLMINNEAILVQKKINEINDGNGNYYYSLCFTTGEDMIMCTAGKVGNGLELMKKYIVGLNFVGGKLKLADYEIVK